MKLNNFFHILGAVSCIIGIYKLSDCEWSILQWPIVSLAWILSSYVNLILSNKYSKEIDRLHKENINLMERATEADTRAWESEMKLIKISKN